MKSYKKQYNSHIKKPKDGFGNYVAAELQQIHSKKEEIDWNVSYRM